LLKLKLTNFTIENITGEKFKAQREGGYCFGSLERDFFGSSCSNHVCSTLFKCLKYFLRAASDRIVGSSYSEDAETSVAFLTAVYQLAVYRHNPTVQDL
jgi:hypothetical protein